MTEQEMDSIRTAALDYRGAHTVHAEAAFQELLNAFKVILTNQQRASLEGQAMQGMLAAFKRWPEHSDVGRIVAFSRQIANAMLEKA